MLRQAVELSPLVSWQVTRTNPLREGWSTLYFQETERLDKYHAPDKRCKVPAAGPAGRLEEPEPRVPGLCRAEEKQSHCIMHRLLGLALCLKDDGRSRC